MKEARLHAGLFSSAGVCVCVYIYFESHETIAIQQSSFAAKNSTHSPTYEVARTNFLDPCDQTVGPSQDVHRRVSENGSGHKQNWIKTQVIFTDVPLVLAMYCRKITIGCLAFRFLELSSNELELGSTYFKRLPVWYVVWHGAVCLVWGTEQRISDDSAKIILSCRIIKMTLRFKLKIAQIVRPKFAIVLSACLIEHLLLKTTFTIKWVVHPKRRNIESEKKCLLTNESCFFSAATERFLYKFVAWLVLSRTMNLPTKCLYQNCPRCLFIDIFLLWFIRIYVWNTWRNVVDACFTPHLRQTFCWLKFSVFGLSICMIGFQFCYRLCHLCHPLSGQCEGNHIQPDRPGSAGGPWHTQWCHWSLALQKQHQRHQAWRLFSTAGLWTLRPELQ